MRTEHSVTSWLSNTATQRKKIKEFSECCCNKSAEMVIDNQGTMLTHSKCNKVKNMNIYYTRNGYIWHLVAWFMGALIVTIFGIVLVLKTSYIPTFILPIPIVISVLMMLYGYFKINKKIFPVFIVINNTNLIVYTGKANSRIGKLQGLCYGYEECPVILKKYWRHWTTSSGSGSSNRRRTHHYAYFTELAITGLDKKISGVSDQKLLFKEVKVKRNDPCPQEIDNEFNEYKEYKVKDTLGFDVMLEVIQTGMDDNTPNYKLIEGYTVKPIVNNV